MPKTNSIQVEWSDGSPFTLAVGQVWKSESEDQSVTILSLDVGNPEKDGDKVEFYLDTPADTDIQALHGADGFIDFLESCCYELAEPD